MSRQVKHRIEAGMISVMVACICLLWRENQALNPPTSSSIHWYGKLNSPKTVNGITQLHQDLENIQDVLDMDTYRIRIRTRNGQITEYRFDDTILWKDLEPLISDVHAFHFEYRDENGNLLTCRPQYRDRIHRIEYTLSLANSNVYANGETMVASW